MKKLNNNIKVMMALILVLSILLLPMDTLALVGTESGATPDERDSRTDDLSATGASVLSGEGSQDNPYLIQSSDDWDALADSVLDGTSYEGKIILLEEDITVTRSLGHTDDISSASSPSYEFDGTFDGGGHTMTFTPPADSNANYVAPFSIVKNATIRNLKVEGEITAFNNLSGLVGAPKGTLMVENVLVDVDVEGNFIGGFVGHGVMADMTFRSCAFTGNLNGDTLAGGFVCWRGPVAWEASGNPALHIENCLFAGSASGAADFHPIGFTQQTNVSAEISDMWATADGQNNGKGFYNYQYQGTSYRYTAATVVSGISSSRPWMGYFDVIDCPPVEGTFADALNVWTAGSTLALLTNVTTGSTISVPSGEHTLDLNGHGILMTGNDRVITINQGASLELNDSDPDRIHYITLTNYRGTAVSDSGEESVSNGNGVIKVTGGYLSGGYRNNSGSHDRCGAGVYNWGTFVMNGGSIVGNTLYNNSGGAIRNSGYFTMNGGTIAFNYASGNGGGVTTYVPGGSQGKMTMNGGEISDNYCGSYGGGIQIAGPIEMTGGSVVRNTAGAGGSGVFYDGKNDRFKLSGNPVIKDNSNNDDLYLGANATFMINGSLTEEADIHVLMNTPAEFTVGWKNIMGNADPSKYFTSDDSNYAVILNNNGEAEVGIPPAVCIINGETTTYYNVFSDAQNAWTEGSTLKLMKDVTTDSTITVPSGEHTLDLNGCGIKMTGNGSVFVVGSGSKMIINDSNTDAEHKYTLSNTQSNGAGFATVNDSLTSGYKTFKGGYITGGNGNTRSSWREGGALHITGEVEMNAGTLIGNGKYGTTHGGGFETRDSGRFVMHGGSIQNNGGYCGGGCRLVGGSAEIDGGRIIDNIATNDGGGIHVGGTLPLVLKDCEISGNYANGGPGAGIWMSNVGTEISGKTVIKDNYVGNKADNIEIQKDKLIGIGNLTDGASIGITMQSGPAVFTSGWKDNMGEADPSKYFTSDNEAYEVFLNNDGEAEIGVPPVACVISGDTTTNYGSLSEAVNAWTAGSTLKLLDDVSIDTTITVPSGEHTLDLNGHGIKMTGSGSVINVGNGATLNLDDSNTDTTHKFDVPDGAGLAALNETSGTYTVNGGYITGGNSNQGGVYVKGGTLILTGGTIIGNQAQREGGGVIIGSGSCTMNGGAIIYNKSQTHWGGGINVGGPFNMSGGVVSHNYAGEGAGGVHCHSLVMTGGSITDNYAAGSYAGGVNVNNNATLSGNITITDNTNNTGKSNLYCKSVIIADTLSDTSSIGIKTQSGTGTFTTGWKDKMGNADPSKYFTSDDSNYAVILNNNGEAEIAPPPVASVINGDTTTNYSTIPDAVSAWTADSTLKLLADVTTNSTITVPSGEHTLDLNGYALKAGSTGYSVVTVGSDAELTIDDTSDTVGKITGGSVGQNYGGGVTVDGGTLTLKGGAISGNANTYGGIGNCGGGVHVRNSGKFYMEGGEISGNTSYVGGGVCSDTSATTVRITGGVIKNNKTDRFGSAIWAGRSSSAVFKIGGDAQIIDNVSTWTDDKDGEGTINFTTLKLSGNPTIHGDWKTKGTSAPNTHINLDNDGSGIQRIELDGALTNDSGTPNISISPIYRWNDLKNGKTFVFTKNWKTYMGDADPSEYFKSDNNLYPIFLNSSGEAEIGTPPAACIISGGTTANYSSFSDALNAWTAGSTLKLMADVTTGSTITVPTGTHTLDLNGYTITRTGATGSDNSGLAMTVNNGVDLTVTGPGKITGGKGFHGGGIHVEGNSSLVLDNCEISGNTGHYGGGLYLKNGTITMKNGTVVKENSASEGFGGSGIYAEGGGTLIMDGCTFTQNAIKNNNQYAVFLCGNANIKVSGAPVINDNTYNGAHHDLYMFQAGDQHSTVLIAGALTDGTKITVGQTSGAGVITGGWKDKMGEADPSKYFTSDDSNYSVAAADGEAWLCEELTGVTAEGYEGDYDGEAHGITVSAPDGAAVKYGTTEGSYTLTDNPTYTDAGTYTVYYEVSKTGCIPVYGSEQVKITPIDVTVTITGHTLTVDYDGRAHSADGYDATASSTLYNVTKNITYSGRAEAVRTNVGTTQMGLTAEKFSNTNDNFANVTFYVTDGSVTIASVDAVLTPAPHAKDQLVYNGSNQTLVEPGTVTGGTLCYALGSDEIIPPSDSQYDQDVPVARNVGNYYIWYKVIADSNHNDLAPACVKVTLAEEGWTTVSGRIYDDNNNPVSNAIVSLTIGGKTVDQIISGSDGGYYFTAPPGLYNIVVKYDGATVTDMIDINESTTYDVSIFDANTDSFLNIVGFDSNIVVGGLNKEAEAVRAREGVSSDKNVTVSMTVTPIAGGDTDAAAAIEGYASDRNVLYYDFEVEETVDTISTYLDRTQTVLEIAIPCSFVNKQELAVYTSDGSSVQTLIQSDTKAAGTFRVDTSAGLVYIYTDEITTYALGYKPYYSVTSDVSLGSYTGVVSVTLTKDGETIYELNDVSMDNISFRGVPKGTYSMTITWTDGAENTLTTPFEIQ